VHDSLCTDKAIAKAPRRADNVHEIEERQNECEFLWLEVGPARREASPPRAQPVVKEAAKRQVVYRGFVGCHWSTQRNRVPDAVLIEGTPCSSASIRLWCDSLCSKQAKSIPLRLLATHTYRGQGGIDAIDPMYGPALRARGSSWG